MAYKILIEFETLSKALEYNLNSSIDFNYLFKVFDKYYLFIEEHDIKDISYLLKKD